MVILTTSDGGYNNSLNITQRSPVCANCTVGDDDSVSLDAHLIMRFAYIAVGFVGILGNAVVIGVILSYSKMRKATTNILIANQSGIDLSASLFVILCTLIRDVSAIRGGIIAKEMFCRMWANNIPMWALFVSSSYNLVCITLERYSGICYPMRHNITCSKGKAAFAMAFAWLIGPAYIMAFNVPTAYYEDGMCNSMSKWASLAAQRSVGFFTVVLQFFIPLIIITFAYAKIVQQLREDVGSNSLNKTDNPQNSIRQEIMKRARKNVIKTLVIVAVSFVICCSPNQIVFTMFICGYDVDLGSTFYHFTVLLAFANCCINPFIYSLQYEQFKKVMFRRCRNTQDSLESRVTQTTSEVEQKSADVKDQNIRASRHIVEFDNVCFEGDSSK